MARAIGNPTQLWRTNAALGDNYAQRGEKDAAQSEYRIVRDLTGRALL